MKYLNLLWLWLKNIFVFGKPVFSLLTYTDYIVEDKSYFVFTWRLKNAYHLKIKSTGFKSTLQSGSAYASLIGEHLELKIVISSVWRSESYVIKLKKISIDSPIEFRIALRNKFPVKLNLPNMGRQFVNLKVDRFKVQMVEQRTIKSITNISYPN